MLFADEPDEDSGPGLWQDEGEERLPFLFQDEAGEPDETPLQTRRSHDASFRLLRDEPDEPFDVEPDEHSGCSSDESAYLADAEDLQGDEHAIVRLNFSTLNKFLTKHLFSNQSDKTASEPVKKKRRYNNTNRARAAENRKESKLISGRKRMARNNPDLRKELQNIFVFFPMAPFFDALCFSSFCGFWFHVINFYNAKERLAKLLSGVCKCSEGSCYKELKLKDVQTFMDQFEEQGKREQDTILYLALEEDGSGQTMNKAKKRREFHFLGHYMKRQCWECLLGVSSHRVDRLGAFDMRYGARPRPSHLTASIDAFCMVLYNSVAEPLPNKFLCF